MKLLKDIEDPIDSIEAFYEFQDKNFTSNLAYIIETPRGLQGAAVTAVDEQAVNQGIPGMIRASLIATGATSVICHQPIDIPTLEGKKSPNHFNWTLACHINPRIINRHVIGECISNPETQEFRTTIIQELDQASGFNDLSFLPPVFQNLGDYICVDDKNEITRARKFLEETQSDLTWNWSDYDVLD